MPVCSQVLFFNIFIPYLLRQKSLIFTTKESLMLVDQFENSQQRKTLQNIRNVWPACSEKRSLEQSLENVRSAR